jgi:uncharacterized protein (DUF1499 family)
MQNTALLFAFAALAFPTAALWVRFAPSDPAQWHVDPATAPDPTRPNFARAEHVLPLPPAAVRERLDAIARTEGAEVLAEDPALVTYVARSRVVRYPDYISVRIEDNGAGSTHLQAFSRARFGVSDLGVNRSRLARWLRKLEA